MICNCDKLQSDISKYKTDEEQIIMFRSAHYKGPLYFDSKNLRSELIPIPSNCIRDLENIFRNLMFKKIDYLLSVYKHCSKQFRREPTTLDMFVNYCDFFERAKLLEQKINIEVAFIDDLVNCLMILDSNLQITLKIIEILFMPPNLNSKMTNNMPLI